MNYLHITEDSKIAYAQFGANSPELRRFFDSLRVKKKDNGVTELDTLIANLAPDSAHDEVKDRSQAVALLRKLEALGAGRFRLGRRGKATRFIWAVSPSEVLAAIGSQVATEAKAPADEAMALPEEAKAPAEKGESRTIRHSYVLRKDLVLFLELPLDLSRIEAKRLAAFMETLPLVENEKGVD